MNLGVAPSKEVRHGYKAADSKKETRRESQVEREEERGKKIKERKKGMQKSKPIPA